MNKPHRAQWMKDTSATDAAAARPQTGEGQAADRFTMVRLSAILGVIIAAICPWVLLGQESFFYRDFGVLAYPFAYFQHESFWHGELPLWNPLSHCGVPFLAQWGTNLYPFSLIYLLFPLPWSLDYFCLLHLLLAGLGMYWLAWRWVGNRYAATVAGVVYVANGVMLSCHIWPNYLAALGWLPWVVGCAQAGWREGGRWLVVAALVGALQMLCGVPELILFTWILLGVLWLNDGRKSKTPKVRLAGRFLFVVLLVAGLTAVQLLPFFDLLAHSQRDTNFGTAKWAMPLWGWANLFVPLFHYWQTPQGPWFQAHQEFMTSYYLGLGVLVLSCWAVWRVRNPKVRLLAAVALISLILALGDGGFLFGWIKQAIPLVGVGRYPIKFVLLTAFLLPLLTAWAIDGLQQSPVPPGDRRALGLLGLAALIVVAGILWAAKVHPMEYDQWSATLFSGISRLVLLLAVLALAWHLSSRTGGRKQVVCQWLLLAVLALDGLTHVPGGLPTVPAKTFAPGVWRQANTLSPPRPGESRVMITPTAERRLLHSSVADPEQDFLGKRMAEWSNLNLLDGIPKVNGAATLQIREQKEVEQLIYDSTNGFGPGLVNFLAVSRMSAPDNPVAWIARTNACRMVTCGQQPVFADAPTTLAGLASTTFDPRQTVFLPAEIQSQISVRAATQCRILATAASSYRLGIDVEAREPSLVVVAQTYYHPWRARVDGKAARIWRANHAFQAVEVPAGTHHLELVYRDTSLWVGAGLSGLAALFCWYYYRRSQRRI